MRSRRASNSALQALPLLAVGILGAPGQAEQLILGQVLEDHLQRHAAHHPRPPGQAGGHRDGRRNNWRALQGRSRRFLVGAARRSRGWLPAARRSSKAGRCCGSSGRPSSPDPRRHPCSRTPPARRAEPSSVYRMRQPKRRLMAAPPTSTGNLQAAALQLVDDQRHLLAGVDQQSAQPDGVWPCASTALVMIVSAGTCLPRSITV